MKFLFITNLYEPYARGGAERVVQNVAEGLAARGHEVVVLTTGPMRYGFWPREERVSGVRVLRFSPWNFYFVGNDWKFPKFVRAAARLWEMISPHPGLVTGAVIKRERPDAVLTHNLVGFGMRVPRLFQKRGVRHIHTLHDVQLVHPSGLLLYGREKRAERSFARRLYERAMRRLWGSPAVVISPSKWLLDFYLSRGFFPKSKTIILPNSVDCRHHQRSATILHTTSYLLPTRLLYAGQLEPHKGVRWLLSAFSVERPAFSVEFAGAGSLEGEIKKAAERDPDHIIFHGKLSPAALQERFAEVNALVVPSLCYENAPRIISEALGAGLPVIAVRIGGIPEMVRDGENGFLFEPGNVADFLKAVSHAVSISSFSTPSVGRKILGVAGYLDKILTIV